MSVLTFSLSSELDEEDNIKFNELNEVLSSLNINFEICKKSDLIFLKINYDTDKIDKVMTRNAGRPRAVPNDYLSPAEIRERMKTESAEDVAQSLGISRSTLFRKLKQAEESGLMYLM